MEFSSQFIFWITCLFVSVCSKEVEESLINNSSTTKKLTRLECQNNEPSNLTIDNSSKTSTSFRFTWDSPPEESPCNFSHYKISIDGPIDKAFRLSSFHLVASKRGNKNSWILRDLEPGRTYVLMVQGVNGNFSSIAAVETVTLEPLSVCQIQTHVNDTTGWLEVSWQTANASYQDKYKIQYREVEKINVVILMTVKKNIIIREIIGGKNYSIGVTAISRNVESKEIIVYRFIEAVGPEKNVTRALAIEKIEMEEKIMREQKSLLEETKKKLTAMRIKARNDVDVLTYDLVSKWREDENSTKCFELSRGNIYDKQKLIQIQIKNCVNNQLDVIREKEQSGEIFNSFLRVTMDWAESETSACVGNSKLLLGEIYKNQDKIIENCIEKKNSSI